MLRKQERTLLLSFTHIAEGHYLNISADTFLVVIIIMIKQVFHRTTEVSVKKINFMCTYLHVRLLEEQLEATH